MEAIIDRGCGIDVHKKTILVCLMEGCSHVAMESTGVYWKPVFNIREESMEIILANSRDIKNVPGRKTDVKDCEWIAQLLRHGLIKGSFIPPRPIRELRDLTRYRRKLIQQKSSEINRIHKLLEDANIKLSSVVTDINGVSAQDMIYHLIKEDMTPKQMAELAKGRLRNKITELEKSLEGHLRDHHRLILKLSIEMIASYDQAIEKLNLEIDQRMEPYKEESDRLQTIPGVKKKIAESIVSEIGVDMSRFPSHAHISSWAGVSPGNNESAGKRHSGKTTQGNKWLKGTLTEAAWSASKTKGTYLNSRYKRLASRRGKKRASLAIAHTILIMAYHVIKEQCTYKELGGDYFDRLNEEHLVKRLSSRIQALGYKVEVQKLPVAA